MFAADYYGIENDDDVNDDGDDDSAYGDDGDADDGGSDNCSNHIFYAL